MVSPVFGGGDRRLACPDRSIANTERRSMSEHEPIARSTRGQSELPRVGFVAGTLGRGGAERQLYYMARALVDEGQPPVVASLTRGEHWEQPIKELGVPVVWFGRSANPLLRTLDLIRALRPYRPQLLQSAHFHTNLYAVGAARVLRSSNPEASRPRRGHASCRSVALSL